MVEVRAFPAVRYTPSFKGDYGQLVAPPYDVIGPADLQRLWDRSPYNVVRLILPAGDLLPDQRDRGYQLAAERLRRWKAEGVLVADPNPALYYYRQQFQLAHGRRLTRQGFFALARLTEWNQGIYRHELTLPGPVSDRIRLLEECHANLSSIFGLYSDPTHEVAAMMAERAEAVPPAVEVVDDGGVAHALWVLDEPALVQRVTSLLRDRPIVVADGHHRYTAALEYRNRRRAEGQEGLASWDYVLFYLTALEDPGLVILPTHQVLHGLPGFGAERFVTAMQSAFTVQELPTLTVLMEHLDRSETEPDVFLGAVAREGRCFLLQASRPQTALEDALDVAILRRWAVAPLLADNSSAANVEAHLRYTHDAAEAAAWVTGGEADVAFLLRPTPLDAVRTLALAHKVMPQKSTYFWPKVLSGLVIHDFGAWSPKA
ncbi:MAG: DUF1015 domain-containing protein [Anaerolineae bacterium]